jgi:glycosyltransferase 2 family protein
MKRGLRIAGTLILTGLALGYIAWQVDLRQAAETLADANILWFALAVAIMLGTVPLMALRWKWLLAAQGVHDSVRWLTRSYLVSYAAGQLLPTSIGGDAMRIFESTRRHGGRTADFTAIVLLERALGGAATLLLGAIGFVLAVGRYDVSAYIWVEGGFVVAACAVAVIFFSRAARPLLGRLRPLLGRLRIERPLRGFYDGVHHYRSYPRLLVGAFAYTTALQAVRVLAIWAAARAVGIELGPRIYYVMGPLFFLVALIPFTLNGIAVREAFFVSFLGSVGVAGEPAFAAGFVFFIVTVALALPGWAILARRGVRSRPRPVGDG